MIERDLFRKCYPDFDKLIQYGFELKNDEYFYKRYVLEDSFLIEVHISKNGKVVGSVFDLELEDEYTSFRIEDHIGEFAGQIREIFINTLEDIRKNCFYMQPFIAEQSNRISQLIMDKYGDTPFFEWESTPDFGVFKHKDTHKWYGLVMHIDRSKLEAGEGEFDIINIKLDPSEINQLIKEDGYYPAYHMNKKYWISISLDDTLEDNTIMNLIDESYCYAAGRSVEKSSREWIIPANPKYYDIDEGFRNHKVLDWKQSSNIQVGDIVYIYVGSPVSAIRYKCKVLKNNIPYSYRDDNVCMNYVMELELIDKYDKEEYPFSLLKEFGVNAVRGPRFMPKKLSEFINKNAR